MENVHLDLNLNEPVNFFRISEPAFLLPELKGFEDSLMNYFFENKKAPLTDQDYISDKEYVVSIAQY